MGVKTRKKARNKSRLRIKAKSKQREQNLKRNPIIKCMTINKAWDKNKCAPSNLADMGLVFNLNKAMPVSNKRKETSTDNDEPQKKKKKQKTTEVVEELEKTAESSNAVNFVRLTKSQVQYATDMLDKYGHDYKAMVKDPKNYYQDTWKQIRAKIKLFTGKPQYYVPYLKDRGLLESELEQIEDK